MQAALLFASGVAALIYQALWVKQLSLVVGVDVYAITLCVSAFFAGLALGGYVFGRAADHVARPVLLFTALEAGTALLGIAATFTLAHSAGAFASLESWSGPLAWAFPFLIVGVPACLMGGTLPVLVRSLPLPAAQLGAVGGRLYAANTAGAVAGALLTSFILIPQFGVQRTALVAAAVNAAAALGALVVMRSSAVRGAEPAVAIPVRFSSRGRLALILYAIAGGIALGYEVVWAQTLVQFMSTRSFAFSVVLATYLAALVAGSALFARRADRVRDPWGVFGVLIASAGLVALLEIAFLGRWLIILQTQAELVVLTATRSQLAGMCARFTVAALSIVAAPALLLGAAFPAALRLAVDMKQVGRSVGRVVAANTLGGIAGTILVGFALLPALGIVHTLAFLAVCAAAVGIVAALRGAATPQAVRATIAIGGAAVVAALLVPSSKLADMLPGARGGELVFYQESRGGTVAVVERQSGRHNFKRLYIQGVSNSGDAMPSLRYMRLQALLPLIIHNGEPRSALVVGLGTGITAGALLQYPGLDRRVCAELLPAVVKAAPLFQGNFGAGTDPHLEIRVRDGRRELLRNSMRYDLITLEPPPPSAAGVVNLYSSDFYRLAAERLQPNGIFAQWLPLSTQNDEDSRSLVRSFLDVFPSSSLWTTEFHEMLLVGSSSPIVLDASRINERMSQLGVRAALSEIGITSPAALLATWITDRAGLERYVDGAPPVTDDQPRIEYATWVRPGEIARVLPRLLALRSEPPLREAGPALLTEIASEQDRLFHFYDAGLQAYGGNRELWAITLRRVLSEDGRNPYYRSFVGVER